MRIRKRQVPLPFSSLSPAPLSDPLLLRRPSPVQLQPSDPPNPLHRNGLEKEEGEENEEEGEERNDTRERISVFGAETSNGVLLQSSSSPQVVGRWCEREKAFPLKKRRGSCLERPIRENDELGTTVKSSEKKTMKTKMNKKCTMLVQKQEQPEESKPAGLDVVVGKKRSRGGALMEGSRCSRVNGRGWRCCQQTLVGYSLCEHHLGKGRLRSMNSVRSRSLAAAATAPKSSIIVEEEGEKKPPPPPPPPPPLPLPLASKKRMKLGVVKARSISSLLGQTDSVMAAPSSPPPPPPPPDDNNDK